MIRPKQWLSAALAAGVLISVALAGATTAAQGMPSVSASATGTSTYTDPFGDAQGGPDVTSVTVTGDPATKMIRVEVNAPGYLSGTADGLERDVQVWLDTDRNWATGDPEDGTEFGFIAWNDPTGRWYSFTLWNGTEWVHHTRSLTMSFDRQGEALSWTVNSADLGGSTSFRFYVLAGIWSETAEEWTARDDAPDGDGWWDYSLAGTTPAPPPAAETKVNLMISKPTIVPKVATAGRRLTVTFDASFAVERPTTTIDLQTGETREGIMTFIRPVERGTMVCNPSVAGRVIPHNESLKNGEARLTFVIPAAAKGKLLMIKVKITATEKETGRTVTASRIATFRVR